MRTIGVVFWIAVALGCSGGDEKAAALVTVEEGYAACDDYAAHAVASCPGAMIENYRVPCQRDMAAYIPTGCGNELLAHYQCKGTTTLQCTGPESPECDDWGVAVGPCITDFNDRTSCFRPDFIDTYCSDGQFGYLCNGSPPSGCIQSATAPDVRTYCCAQYPN